MVAISTSFDVDGVVDVNFFGRKRFWILEKWSLRSGTGLRCEL